MKTANSIRRRNLGAVAGAAIAAMALKSAQAQAQPTLASTVGSASVDVMDFLTANQKSSVLARLGTVDLSVPLQAAIDSIGRGTGQIRRGEIRFPPGVYAWGTQLEVAQQGIRFVGIGGAEWRWIGNNTTHMMRVIDSSRCEWLDLTILGKDAAQPLSAIYFDEPVSSKIGTNEYHVLRNVSFGRRWTQDTTAAGKMQVGLRIGGASNTNNDSFYLDNVQFHDCTVRGLSIENAQSIWGSLKDITFNACGVGIYSGSNITGYNVCFNRSSVRDFEFFRDITVNLHTVNSENAAQIGRVSQGASVHIDGGKLLVGLLHTAPNWLDVSAGNFLTLRNLQVVQTGGTGKKLKYTGSAAITGNVLISQCRLPGGDDGSGFEFQQSAAMLGSNVDISHGQYSKKGLMKN